MREPPLVLWVAVSMAVIAYGFAFYGLWDTGEYSDNVLTFLKLVYHAAGVLAFEEPEAADQAHWVYDLARPFALMFGLLAATGVVLEVFRPVRDRILKTFFEIAQSFRPSTVVVGLGWIGAPLVTRLRALRRPVVAVALDDEAPPVDEARRRGTLVLIGDVTDAAMQARVPFEDASEVFLATGDDSRNVEIAGALLEASREWSRSRSRGPLRCYVHLESAEREQALARHGLWGPHGDNLELQAFSQPELASRDLFFHPDRGIGLDASLQPAPRTDEVFHLFVIGFGPTGQAVARHLARFGHFASLQRPRLTVFSRAPDAEFRGFLQRHPAFSPPGLDLLADDLQAPGADGWSCRHGRPIVQRFRCEEPLAIEYVVNAEVIELDDAVESDEITGAIRERLALPGRAVRAAIVVCFEEDRISFESALSLQHALFNSTDEAQSPVPIYVYLPVDHGLATVIDPDRGLAPEVPGTPGARFPLRPFGRRDEVASYERITRPDLAMHARGARRVYERLEPDRTAQLHPDFVASNLDAAQHAVIKLTALGIRLTEPGEEPPAGRPRVLAELLTSAVDEQVRAAAGRERDAASFGELPVMVRQRLALLDTEGRIDSALAEAAIDAAVDDFEADLRRMSRDPQLVAEMEHHRWMGERLTAGWRYGPRSDALRMRPSMIPYAALGANDQRHDRVDLVRFLVQEWAWGRAPYFGEEPAPAGSSRTTGSPRRSA